MKLEIWTESQKCVFIFFFFNSEVEIKVKRYERYSYNNAKKSKRSPENPWIYTHVRFSAC